MTRLVSCYFGHEPDWERLARVLEFSARRHCPGWDIDVRKIDAPLRTHGLSASRVANTHKLEWWTDQVELAEDGSRLLLIDVDTMILGPLDEAWSEDFDFGYTVKEGRYPFNAGVVFLRISARTKEFMKRWRDENRRMFLDPVAHEPWRRQFAGMNQAALGKLLSDHAARDLGVRLGGLACSQWNCENATWSSFSAGSTRIVHLKDALRPAALSQGPNSVSFMHLVQIWRSLERERISRLTRSPET